MGQADVVVVTPKNLPAAARQVGEAGVVDVHRHRGVRHRPVEARHRVTGEGEGRVLHPGALRVHHGVRLSGAEQRGVGRESLLHLHQERARAGVERHSKGNLLVAPSQHVARPLAVELVDFVVDLLGDVEPLLIHAQVLLKHARVAHHQLREVDVDALAEAAPGEDHLLAGLEHRARGVAPSPRELPGDGDGVDDGLRQRGGRGGSLGLQRRVERADAVLAGECSEVARGARRGAGNSALCLATADDGLGTLEHVARASRAAGAPHVGEALLADGSLHLGDARAPGRGGADDRLDAGAAVAAVTLAPGAVLAGDEREAAGVLRRVPAREAGLGLVDTRATLAARAQRAVAGFGGSAPAYPRRSGERVSSHAGLGGGGTAGRSDSNE